MTIKYQQVIINNDSYGRLSTKYKMGAKEGVVHAINLDVKTLSNYHEAMFKSAGKSRHTGSERESANKDSTKSEKRKNIFSRSQTEKGGTKLSDLFKKKEKVIGDSDDREYTVPQFSLNESKPSKPRYKYEETIEEQQNEEEEYIEASERMAYEIYFDLVDGLTVRILNNTFHDIRIETDYDVYGDNIIDSTIRSLAKEIVTDAYKFWAEDEEWRIREIKAKEERKRADTKKREDELIEKRRVRAVAINQFDQASEGIFDQMILELVQSMVERTVHDEKQNHIRELNLATRQYNNNFIYHTLGEMVHEVAEDCLNKAIEQKEYEEQEFDELWKLTRYDIIEDVIMNETYKTTFESITNEVNNQTNNSNNNIMNILIQQMIQETILASIIPETIQMNVLDSVTKK
jgi:hypothetical protein